MESCLMTGDDSSRVPQDGTIFTTVSQDSIYFVFDSTALLTSPILVSQERIIETNISTLELAPMEYWNWTYTVTEPLNSNL